MALADELAELVGEGLGLSPANRAGLTGATA